MQNLIWVGDPCFAGDLSECGWNNIHTEQVSSDKKMVWNDLVDAAGFIPDVVVIADSDQPPFIKNIEEFPCLTVFYSSNAHDRTWHELYAQAFDACMVSSRDYLERFERAYLDKSRIWWSPPFAAENKNLDLTKTAEFNCMYIGSYKEEGEFSTKEFMKNAKAQLPALHFPEKDRKNRFYPGQILLHHMENHQLDFKLFEAMGSAACLVAPRINNGLEQLFVDGEHYVGYKPGDAGDAAVKIEYLLKYPELVDHISKTGYEEIKNRHLSRHRAEALTDNLCGLFMAGGQELIQKRLLAADKIRSIITF